MRLRIVNILVVVSSNTRGTLWICDHSNCLRIRPCVTPRLPIDDGHRTLEPAPGTIPSSCDDRWPGQDSRLWLSRLPSWSCLELLWQCQESKQKLTPDPSFESDESNTLTSSDFRSQIDAWTWHWHESMRKPPCILSISVQSRLSRGRSYHRHGGPNKEWLWWGRQNHRWGIMASPTLATCYLDGSYYGQSGRH